MRWTMTYTNDFVREVDVSEARKPWTREEAYSLYEASFNDLLFQSHTVHRASFDPNRVQLSRLISIKTGGCPEDCGYCSQSAHHDAGFQADGSGTRCRRGAQGPR